MGYYDRTRPPPDASELPGVVAGLIADPLDGFLHGGGIHTGQAFPVKPGSPVTARKPPWSRVVVMVPETAFPMGRPMPERSEIVRLQIAVHAAGDPNQDSGWDYAREISGVHRRIFGAINGKRVELDRAEPASPIWFHGWINYAPVRHDGLRVWVQAAEYRVVLRGVQISTGVN